MQERNTPTLFPALSDLTDEHIVNAARAVNEPGWLILKRQQAWKYFAESVPPIWRRTDLTKFKSEQVAAPVGVFGTQLDLDEELAAQGVIFRPLGAVLRDQEPLLEQYFGTAVDPLTHKFTALHAALWQDGVFLYVPKNVSIEKPLKATFTFPEGAKSIFPHNLVIVEEGASVTFIEEYTSGDVEGQAFASPVTELFVGDNASVRYITAQNWGKGVYTVGSQIAKVGNNGNLDWTALNLGSKLQHMEAETYLEGNGSRVEWQASTFAEEGQTLLTAPWLRHIGANTEGHMNFKTVVSGGGYTTFDGMIKIEKGSRATISRLEEHAIHLSDKARSDSIPGLRIDTNDVQRAGHASTSGQVDEEMLFYMRSRGIQQDDAIKLIVMGFFEPVLDRLPNDMRERMTGIIEEKI